MLLVNKKGFLPISQVKGVEVPLYDELSVVQLWPLMQKNAKFMFYFPDQLPKGRVPDRKYFFDVMNTVEHEYTQKMIQHANEMRNSSKNEDQA